MAPTTGILAAAQRILLALDMKHSRHLIAVTGLIIGKRKCYRKKLPSRLVLQRERSFLQCK